VFRKTGHPFIHSRAKEGLLRVSVHNVNAVGIPRAVLMIKAVGPPSWCIHSLNRFSIPSPYKSFLTIFLAWIIGQQTIR
jgi:hypothetical protein